MDFQDKNWDGRVWKASEESLDELKIPKPCKLDIAVNKQALETLIRINGAEVLRIGGVESLRKLIEALETAELLLLDP